MQCSFGFFSLKKVYLSIFIFINSRNTKGIFIDQMLILGLKLTRKSTLLSLLVYHSVHIKSFLLD